MGSRVLGTRVTSRGSLASVLAGIRNKTEPANPIDKDLCEPPPEGDGVNVRTTGPGEVLPGARSMRQARHPDQGGGSTSPDLQSEAR